MDMERSEVVEEILNKYFETLFQIRPLSPFPVATTMVQASSSLSHSANQRLTGLLAPANSHLLFASQWLAEFSVETPSRVMFSMDCMVVFCAFLPSA